MHETVTDDVTNIHPDLEEILALREELKRHSYLYYVCDAPEITDEDYDQKFHRLAELEKLHPEFEDPNSPTKRIGEASTTGFAKVNHARRMLSLDNVFTAQEVLNVLQGEDLVLEPKIDGLSLKLVYKNGDLVQAITRGNGQVGDDVTANARTIRTIPLRLERPESIEVTGEVYMEYGVFNALNEVRAQDGDELFANVRNAAAGALKLKDPKEVSARRLTFVVHGCLTEIPSVEYHFELIAYLSGLSFLTVQDIPGTPGVLTLIESNNVEELAQEIAQADERRKNLCLATDGLVFKINSLAKQRELGEGTRSPKWAVAYKFPPERKATKLKAICLQVGRTGRITPVAELEPVQLSGTTVQRASLCNQDEIQRLHVNVGDVVLVEKSAEIIPKVVGLEYGNVRWINGKAEQPTSLVLKADYFKFAAQCPCCGSALVRPEDLVDYYCVNDECEDQVLQRLIHATGKSALDIDGCGEVMVQLLMEHGVRKLSDLYTISDLSFVKAAARKKFLEGREKAKKASFWRKLHALGIEGFGTSLCQDIAARWTSLEAIFVEPKPEEQLSELDKLEEIVGKVRFASFIDYIKKNAQKIERLIQLGFHFEAQAETIGPLTGKVFCITGALMSGSRDVVMRRIEGAGGTVKNSVTKKVQYLISGTDGGANKAQAAARLGVEVITEEQLYKMMGIEMPLREDDLSPEREF